MSSSRKQPKQQAVIFAFCLVPFAFCLAGCRRAPANASAVALEPKISYQRLNEVSVVEAQAAPTAGELLIPAALSVDDVVIVAAPRTGIVTGLSVAEGGRVTQGQVIAVFEEAEPRQAELRNQLQQQQIEVERAKVEEQQYAAAIKVSQNELEREKYLFREGVTSQAEVERVQYRLDQAQKEYEKVRLATRTAQARVVAVQLELRKTVVVAPLSGYIIKRHVNDGTTVAANEKLYEISRLSPVKLKFQVPQTSGVPLRAGQLVSLSLAGNDQIVAAARILRPEPLADAASNTYGYVAELAGNPGLRPGVAVNVHLPASNARQAVLVPRVVFPPDARLEPGASSVVFVVENNRIRARDVLIHGTEGDQVWLRAGVAPGERVVVAPAPNLKNGDSVTIH